jgi:ketosteroid isomerase-like protein
MDGRSERPDAARSRGADRRLQDLTTAFPDFSVASVTLIGQGDLVANEWSARGTHTGPLPRADGGADEPTGRSFARTGVGIVEVRNNQIVRYRDYFDRQTMTDQLGLA